MGDPDQLLVRSGRRHHRKRYSLTEVRLGMGILTLLGAIAGWVAWRGAHPDAARTAPIFLPSTPHPPGANTGGDSSGAYPSSPAVGGSAREGAHAPHAAAQGWEQAAPSTFGPENLYTKINGREGYYKDFGFVQLTYTTLTRRTHPDDVVDLEIYDLGAPQNALGAMAGERPPEGIVRNVDGGQGYFTANAFFFARGTRYVRAVGSDAKPEIMAQLSHLHRRLSAAWPRQKRSWAHVLFVDRLGCAADSLSYHLKNAFTFAFADDFYSAIVPRQGAPQGNAADEEGRATGTSGDETEVFASLRRTAAQANRLARRLNEEGFAAYGTATVVGSTPLIKDRYISTFATAETRGRLVIGVRGAPTAADALRALKRLRRVGSELPLPPPRPHASPPAKDEYAADHLRQDDAPAATPEE